MDLLTGKLSYLGAAGLALYGLYQLLSGDPDAIKTFAEAAGIAGLRRKLGVVGADAQTAAAPARSTESDFTGATARATGLRQ